MARMGGRKAAKRGSGRTPAVRSKGGRKGAARRSATNEGPRSPQDQARRELAYVAEQFEPGRTATIPFDVTGTDWPAVRSAMQTGLETLCTAGDLTDAEARDFLAHLDDCDAIKELAGRDRIGEVNLGAVAAVALLDADLDPLMRRCERTGAAVRRDTRAGADFAAWVKNARDGVQGASALPAELREEITSALADWEARIVPPITQEDPRSYALEAALAGVAGLGARRRIMADVLASWDPSYRVPKRGKHGNTRPTPKTLKRRTDRERRARRGMSAVPWRRQTFARLAPRAIGRAGAWQTPREPQPPPMAAVAIDFPESREEWASLVGWIGYSHALKAMYLAPTWPEDSPNRRHHEHVLVRIAQSPEGRRMLAVALRRAAVYDRVLFG